MHLVYNSDFGIFFFMARSDICICLVIQIFSMRQFNFFIRPNSHFINETFTCMFNLSSLIKSSLTRFV